MRYCFTCDAIFNHDTGEISSANCDEPNCEYCSIRPEIMSKEYCNTRCVVAWSCNSRIK
jgi:hypothetical protein